MRAVIKTANRFDTLWTTAVMLPAFLVLMNTGIAAYQGGDTQEFKHAANNVASQLMSQYTPVVETTGSAIIQSVQKVAGAISSCAKGANSPIYLNPALASSNKCSMGNAYNSKTPRPIKVYTSY